MEKSKSINGSCCNVVIWWCEVTAAAVRLQHKMLLFYQFVTIIIYRSHYYKVPLDIIYNDVYITQCVITFQ